MVKSIILFIACASSAFCQTGYQVPGKYLGPGSTYYATQPETMLSTNSLQSQINILRSTTVTDAILTGTNTWSGTNTYVLPILFGDNGGIHGVSGNTRGINAIDLQLIRFVVDEVASGDYSVIGGGYANKASGMYATVPGGYNNAATGGGALALGNSATASGANSFMWGDGLLAGGLSPNNNTSYSAWFKANAGFSITVSTDKADGGLFMRDNKVGIGPVDGKAPMYPLDVRGTVRIHGSGEGLIFPDGSEQYSAAASAGASLTANQTFVGVNRFSNDVHITTPYQLFPETDIFVSTSGWQDMASTYTIVQPGAIGLHNFDSGSGAIGLTSAGGGLLFSSGMKNNTFQDKLILSSIYQAFGPNYSGLLVVSTQGIVDDGKFYVGTAGDTLPTSTGAFLSAGLTAGWANNGPGVKVIGDDGRIPAFNSTYFANATYNDTTKLPLTATDTYPLTGELYLNPGSGHGSLGINNDLAGTTHILGEVDFRQLGSNRFSIIGYGDTNALYPGELHIGASNVNGVNGAVRIFGGNYVATARGADLYVSTNSNVGINTASPNPAYKLDVNGLVNCTGYYLNGAPFTGGGANLTGLRYSTDTVSAGLITGTFTTISAANINGRAIQATGYPIYSLGSWYPGAGFYGQGVANGDKQSYGVHGIGWSTNGNKSAGIYGTWDTLDGTGGYAGYFDGDVVSTGPVTAPFFVGSASKLTGLPTLTGLRYSTDTVSVALIDLSTVTTAFQAVGLATQTIHTEIIPVSRINLSTCATSLTGLRYSTDTVSVALVDLSTITSAIALKANTDSPIFTGNVGINTTLPNPTYKLDVNGLVNCTGYYLNGAPFTGGSPVPTRQTFYSGTSATYTRPSSPAPRRICARIVGGGGAGACNNAAVGPSGSASTFNGISAGGGVGGFQYNNNGGLGGVGGSTVTTAGVNFGVPGGYGAEGSGSSLSQIFGGNGGTSCYGGSGSGSNSGSMNGLAGVPNTGAGGGGGSSGGGAGSGGGGAGGCLDYCINAPAATYTYTVGPGGAAPTGCSQGVGGAGATGVIIVDEYY
jgi:hypothetical protein